jgi:hypothetical protein
MPALKRGQLLEISEITPLSEIMWKTGHDLVKRQARHEARHANK